MRKISICTVCMNRVHHLCQTLPQNIFDNKDYSNIEFVLLNYNSGDNLDAWVKETMTEYVQSGILRYYFTDKPAFFSTSHAKNMALKLATGEILCTIDADNFTGPGYATWVNKVFDENGNNTIITASGNARFAKPDVAGKFCFHRDIFHAVRGFDESMIGYGMEDIDFVNRITKAGGHQFFINDGYLKFIEHTMEERLENHRLMKSLENIYVKYPDTSQQKIVAVYLLKDHSFFEVIFHHTGEKDPGWSLDHFFGWFLAEEPRLTGSFQRNGNMITLTYNPEDTAASYLEDSSGSTAVSVLTSAPASLKKVEIKTEWFQQLVLAYGECMNRKSYLRNDSQENSQVNWTGWGQGEVYTDYHQSLVYQVN